jgi:hypothetical protein
VVYDYQHEIIYYPRQFGIFGLESLRVVECIYAFQFMIHSGIDDPNRAFLVKTGRLINEAELNYIKRIKEGEKAPNGVYEHNWVVYSSQNVNLQYPGLMTSTKNIREITENTFGHKVNSNILNKVCSLSKKRIYKLQNGYYGVNTWQPIEICCALDKNKITRTEKSISILFNKIYKRDPKPEEISICKTLKITNNQDIQDEIERIVEIKIKKAVYSARSVK